MATLPLRQRWAELPTSADELQKVVFSLEELHEMPAEVSRNRMWLQRFFNVVCMLLLDTGPV